MSREHSVTIRLHGDELAAVLEHAAEGEAAATVGRRLMLAAAGHEPRPRLPSWITPSVRERMGVEPDTSIAAEAGVNRATVARWRKRLEEL